MAEPVRSALADNVLARLKAMGMSAREASLKTKRGPDVIRNLLRSAEAGRDYHPRTDTLQLIAGVLETSPEWLMGSHDDDDRGAPTAITKPLPKREDPSRLVPVYASTEGGSGSMVLQDGPVSYEPRPNLLPNEDDLYGVVIEGTSMLKAYRPGDTAWLHPKYRERRDEACVFRRYDETTGDVSMTIKWLVDFNSTTWKVEQLNPHKEIELPRSEWPECYRVLGKKNRA